MIYVKAYFDNGYHTCDEEQFYVFQDSVTKDEIEYIIEQDANDYFIEFEYLATDWDGEFDSVEEEERYYNNCTYSWEFSTEEEYKAWKEETGRE